MASTSGSGFSSFFETVFDVAHPDTKSFELEESHGVALEAAWTSKGWARAESIFEDTYVSAKVSWGTISS